MAKVTIDGKEYEVADGSLILEAVMGEGIHIPTFCYQKRLTPLASCRMCLVEIEGQPKLAPACVTRVADGMVVNTTTERVSNTRESMLELLLANHPLDCPICDKAGECELQNTVFEYGAGVSSFRDEKRVFRSKDLSLNQVIIFNANRCIQCQRCVRMCEEVVGAVALGTIDRGMDSEITGFENSLVGCDHCGNCIEVCPVGALMSQPYRYTARSWDLIETDTTCAFCGTGCQLSVGNRDGKLARVRSKYETGINGETLCAKGRFGADFIDSDDRLTTPMVRKGRKLVSVSWDEAMNTLLQLIGNNVGMGRSSGLVSAGLSCETLYLFQKMMRTVFQTNNIDCSNRWTSAEEDGSKLYDVLPDFFNSFYEREPLESLLEADCVLVVGSHVTDDNPVTDYLIRLSQQHRPNRLLLASARPSRLDTQSVASLRLLPGREARLFAALEASLTSEATGKISPLFDAFIAQAGALLEASQKISILIGSDIFRSAKATEALFWLQTYVITLKSLGKQVSIQFLFDRSNQLGAWELGLLPNVLPGWRHISNPAHRTLFEEAWNCKLPLTEGEDIHGILQSCAEGDMDMLYCLHSDPLSFYPDRELVEQSLSKVKVLVVQASHRSAITDRADIVLPGAGYGEEEGTLLNNEGRLQKLEKFRPPIKSARSNRDIFQQVTAVLGHQLGPCDSKSLFTELSKLVPSFSGIKYTDIKDPGSLTKIKPDVGLAKSTLPPRSLPKGDCENHPTDSFMLITGESRFHSGGLSLQSETLRGIEGEAYIEINKEVGLALGFQESERVTIKSNRGELNLPIKFNKYFDPKTVFIPENFPDLHLNKMWDKGEYPCPVNLIKIATA